MLTLNPEDISLIIDPNIGKEMYLPLNLSVDNIAIAGVNASSSADWEIYIGEILKKADKKVAFGGYLEKRNIYQRSTYFKDAANERNIHLGIDFWIAAETSVHAFADGVIHSFQDNQNHGDYGPTILLEHTSKGQTFYSLYGHLSRESLSNIAVGQNVGKGEMIAQLGDASVNGDYAPHLHFQLIIDLEGNSGDYPGVCSKDEISKYQRNCPDPLVYLEL